MSNMNLKRVKKELDDIYNEKYFNNYSNSIIDFIRQFDFKIFTLQNNSYENNNSYLEIKFKNSNKLLLELHIPKSYPFKPFNVHKHHLNDSNNLNINYLKYLSLINSKNRKMFDSKILKFFFKIKYNIEPKFLNFTNSECYCCSSILCSDYWTPSLKIENLLLEYLELIFIKKYSKPDNYLYLLNIYNNLFDYFNNFKLPDELIDKIITYC